MAWAGCWPHTEGPRRVGHRRSHLAIGASIICLGLMLPTSPARATSDQAATSAYLQADYQLVHTGTSQMRRVESTLHALRERIGRECTKAGAGSPQDPESTQLSNELIGAMVTSVVALDRPAGHRFVSATEHLRWSDSGLTRRIRTYTSKVRALTAMAQPDICRDIGRWAASGFKALPPTTLAFAPRFMSVWVGLGELPAALGRYETGADRSLAARIARLESQFTDLEAREVETWGDIMNELELWP
jgi:hypothetical protein